MPHLRSKGPHEGKRPAEPPRFPQVQQDLHQPANRYDSPNHEGGEAPSLKASETAQGHLRRPYPSEHRNENQTAARHNQT